MNVLLLSQMDLTKTNGAAYSRINNYALALHTMGAQVVVSSPLNPILSGQLVEVNEKCINIIGNMRKRNKATRYLYKLFRGWFILRHLRLLSKNGILHANDAVLLFPDNFFDDALVLSVLRFAYRQRVYCEKNELKVGILLNKDMSFRNMPFFPYNLFTAWLNDELIALFDGVIVISTAIEKWATSRNKRTLRIPILIDSSNISFSNKKTSSCDLRIGFMGSLSNKKDGLIDFLGTLVTLQQQGVSFIFEIYGYGSDLSLELLQKSILQLGLSSNVRYMGQVTRDKAMSLMAEYDLLVLPRKNNLQNKYGFSTKLAEYLLSGTAVLVTNVSDNEVYLKHGENAIVIQCSQYSKMASIIREFVAKPEELLRIGKNGRETALEYFAWEKHKDALFQFLSGSGR